MKGKHILRIVTKCIAFAVIFAVCLNALTTILTNRVDATTNNCVENFYAEEENKLDAVYLGSSNCFAFWNPIVAWQEYGIAVHSFASNSQPITATEYYLREARKTQPNAVYIININTMDEDIQFLI